MLWESSAKTLGNFPCPCRQWNTIRFAWFCDTKPPKSTFWNTLHKQMTTSRPTPKHPTFPPAAASLRCRGGNRPFFNPPQSRYMTDTKGARQAPWRRTFLCRPNNHFFELLAFADTFKNTPKTTVFAFVLRSASPIAPVFDNVWRLAFVANFILSNHNPFLTTKIENHSTWNTTLCFWLYCLAVK